MSLRQGFKEGGDSQLRDIFTILRPPTSNCALRAILDQKTALGSLDARRKHNPRDRPSAVQTAPKLCLDGPLGSTPGHDPELKLQVVLPRNDAPPDLFDERFALLLVGFTELNVVRRRAIPVLLRANRAGRQ